MISNNNQNPIRSYGRTELATNYFPQMNPEAAWHKLRSWLRENPRLQCLYAKRSRSFTPAEVSLIFAELGEPWAGDARKNTANKCHLSEIGGI